MATAEITLSCPVARSVRVLQISGMFDLPAEAKASLTLQADLPLEDQPWNVGLVTGPSGAGKSSLARHLWPGAVAGEQDWPHDAALVDGFPAAMGIKDITGLLSAVGLSSPPAWVKPFRVLSNGEAFRASIARALAEQDGLVVVDEFSSVVDRQVAKVASHAVQKHVRRSGRQLIAVTCHYDCEDWLQPDWCYDVAAAEFRRRRVQRHPEIRLDVHPASRGIWPVFSRHHYLSAGLHASARCFAAYHDSRPVAFAAYMHFPHPKTRNIKVSHRAVVLPDWQGLGIGGRIADWLGQHLHEQGYRFRATTGHPARIAFYARSPRWRMDMRSASPGGEGRRAASGDAGRFRVLQRDPRRLSTRTFEYVPA